MNDKQIDEPLLPPEVPTPDQPTQAALDYYRDAVAWRLTSAEEAMQKVYKIGYTQGALGAWEEIVGKLQDLFKEKRRG